MLLPRPTVDLVIAEGDKFDSEQQLVEEALRQLIRKFPYNAEAPHVLLKVVAINSLYGAGVPGKDIEPMARHIAGLHIDAALAEGKPAVADDIMSCPEVKAKYFSFASKFCSWHNPTAYPIYDSHVDESLRAYKKRDHFMDYDPESYSYVEFVSIVNAFRTFYSLNAVSFKQLDKFLWHLGDQLLTEKAEIKAAVKKSGV